MSSVVYAVVFKGEILEGFQVISVKAHLAQLLKVGPDQMLKLFSGKPVVLKKTPDKALAIKYGSALKKIGADVKLKALQVAEAPAAKPVMVGGREINTNFELLPNDGKIFDPVKKPPAPQIHISNLELSEPGAILVAPHKEAVEPKVDLSGFELAEPGAPLVLEPKPEVPRVEPPDFGLDAPGTVLETHHEPVEEVHPDVSGISLAEPGSDLLTETEKADRTAIPPAPDTSNLKLVAELSS